MKKATCTLLLLLVTALAGWSQDDKCRKEIEKIRAAFGQTISGILSDKNKTEKLLDDYKSGRIKPPGGSPTPPAPPRSSGGDWEGKYRRKSREAADERRRREEAEQRYDDLLRQKGAGDTTFVRASREKDGQIKALKDTVFIKEKEIEKGKNIIKLKTDTIVKTRETLTDLTEYALAEVFSVYAWYDPKKGSPYPILVGDKNIWNSESNGLDKDRIERLIITASVLISDKSQNKPGTLTIYEQVGPKKVKDIDVQFERGKQFGQVTLYTLKFEESKLIWDDNGKNILGKKKKTSIFKSGTKYAISINCNNQTFTSGYFLID
jgi:hypothetical protein